VVSFTSRPFYSLEKCPRYSLDQKLRGTQNRSELDAVKYGKVTFGNRIPVVKLIARGYTD
jgi:hypothetical protein